MVRVQASSVATRGRRGGTGVMSQNLGGRRDFQVMVRRPGLCRRGGLRKKAFHLDEAWSTADSLAGVLSAVNARRKAVRHQNVLHIFKGWTNVHR